MCQSQGAAHLVERVLAVGSRLSKVDLSGLEGQRLSVDVNPLAVGLHADLLHVGGQLGEGLRGWRV